MSINSWKQGLMLCMVLFGYGFLCQANAQVSVVDSLRALLVPKINDTTRVNHLIEIAGYINDTAYQESLDLYHESIDLSKSLKYKNGLMLAYVGLSELEIRLGNYSQSMEHGQIAFELGQAANDSAMMARSMIAIGLVNLNIFNYKPAIAALERARDYYGSNIRGKLIASHNIASTKAAMRDTAAAKHQYRQNLEAMRDNPVRVIFAASYNNLGRLFDPIKEGDSAIIYFEKSLEYKYKKPIPSDISNTLINIAEVYYVQGKYDKTEAKLKEAAPLVFESGMGERLVDYHKLAGKLYKAMKKHELASYHFEQVSIQQDSLYEPQMLEQATRTEAIFNSERKQKQIELLSAANKLDDIANKRLRWIIAAIVIGLAGALVMLLILIYRARERNRILKLLKSKNEEIRRQQHEIMLSNEALALQNLRLEELNIEKDGLIGIVAHDIRAPLNRSAALAELIISSGELNESQLRFSNMIKKVSEDGGQLIQDLLELNSTENDPSRVQLKPCNVADVVNVVMHGFHEAAEKKSISLSLKAPEEPPIIASDEKHLTRILDNLISNAIKFTPLHKKVQIRLRTNSEGTIIDIQDDGPGISEEEQKKMFQKFMRLSPRPTGGESSTGLGLSIVKALANQIGAEVRVKSTVGQGSTFSLILRPMSMNYLETKPL